MHISIICIGKLKEKYWTGAVLEYMKRLANYCTVEISEIKEAKLPDNAGEAEEKAVLEKEGSAILARLKKDSYIITLEINGAALSSEKLAEKIQTLALKGRSKVTFVIGGSLGLAREVSDIADFKLSFSAMTFPHQMMRVILLEQIYRSFKIIRKETYHK